MMQEHGSIRRLSRRLVVLFAAALLFAPGCGRKPQVPGMNGPGKQGLESAAQAGLASGTTSPAGAGNGAIASGGAVLPGRGETQKAPMTPAVRREFERRYEKGIELLEKQEYGEASRIFEQLLTESSDPQDASIAAYCLAEICFRNKSNVRALELFKEIVEKYPGTPAADNAKAGIEYLENFHKHEAEYVSPDVEDRKRRGAGR